MAITNQEAMTQLAATKAKAIGVGWTDAYWRGLLVGGCNAYWMTDVITFDQYKTLLDIDHVDETLRETFDIGRVKDMIDGAKV